MTGYNRNATKGNEFVYVIFSRQDGIPRAHGPTEQKAWDALITQKYGKERRIDFKALQLRFERIDHQAVRCDDRGPLIWAKRTPLDNTLKMLER